MKNSENEFKINYNLIVPSEDIKKGKWILHYEKGELGLEEK